MVIFTPDQLDDNVMHILTHKTSTVAIHACRLHDEVNVTFANYLVTKLHIRRYLQIDFVLVRLT